MSDIVKITKDKNTYDLHVMWSLHNKCNYHCSYCPDRLNRGEYNHLNLVNLKIFIDQIKKYHRDQLGYKKILFSFTGGEPTIWPGFQEIVTYIKDQGFSLGLTTNGSVALNFWERTSRFFDYICLSYHPESADGVRFLKTYEYLHNDPETVNPSVRLMMHPKAELWKKSEAMLEEIKKFPNWTYECVHILEDYGSWIPTKKTYVEKDKAEFLEQNAFNSQFKAADLLKLPKTDFNYAIEDKSGKVEKLKENQLINENKVDFKGWSCFIGLEQLFITGDGLIMRSGCGEGGILGTVLKPNDFTFPTKPVTCSKAGCYCPTDVRISKYAPTQKIEFNERAYERDITNQPLELKSYSLDNISEHQIRDLLSSDVNIMLEVSSSDQIGLVAKLVKRYSDQGTLYFKFFGMNDFIRSRAHRMFLNMIEDYNYYFLYDEHPVIKGTTYLKSGKFFIKTSLNEGISHLAHLELDQYLIR